MWARNADGHQTLDLTQWIPDAARLAWLREQRYLAPGPFRERLMQKAADAVHALFVAPMLPVLHAVNPKHLVVSLPGVFSQLPLEAALTTEGSLNTEIALSYLPSLRVGADIQAAASALPASPEDYKVLLVGYGGEDMPHLAEEEARLRAIWGERLTVLNGLACSKRSVFEAMQQPYDIIHAMCHGTYNMTRPMDSALHFRPDTSNDAFRITAANLLALRRLPRRPIVILSACSSGLAADHRTNSFHGLPGSLFRIGARAIVGSRWPVDDKVTAQLMHGLHEELSRAAGPLDAMLQRATRALGPSLRIEDAAAFGVFGIA